MRYIAAVMIVFVSAGIGWACDRPDIKDHRFCITTSFASATASASSSSGINAPMNQSMSLNQSANIPDNVKVRAPLKWHDSEIVPRDPAPFEGSWRDKPWDITTMPWSRKKEWTDAEVSGFPSEKVRVISGIFKAGKPTRNVKIARPDESFQGIHYAGILRFLCEEPVCSFEAIHRTAVETAHKKGIEYMYPVHFGATETKTGGDKSFRIGGGGGGITGDGGVSGGGGIGWGDYHVSPGWLPFVSYECWVHWTEEKLYN